MTNETERKLEDFLRKEEAERTRKGLEAMVEGIDKQIAALHESNKPRAAGKK